MSPDWMCDQFPFTWWDSDEMRQWVAEKQAEGWRIVGAVSSVDTQCIYIVRELDTLARVAAETRAGRANMPAG